MKITKEEIEEMYKVCDSLIKNNEVYGIPKEDLRQELMTRAISVFSRNWKDDKIEWKNSHHRLDNIHIFIRYALRNHLVNIYEYLNADKRYANNYTVPIDNEMVYHRYDEDFYYSDIRDEVPLDNSEYSVIKYILERKADPEKRIPVSKMQKEYGIMPEELEDIKSSLKNNKQLFHYLSE